MSNAVSVTVGGMAFSGWTVVSITAGIDRQARDFSVGITRHWPGQVDVPRLVSFGDACAVRIGDDLVLTGYVDATPVSYDATQVSVGIKGRSRTADLVDCAAITEPGQWRDRRVEEIARALAAPYGIDVVSEVDTGPPVPDHQIEPGETVFESIDRMLTLRGLLSTDDASGRLVLTRTGTAAASTALVLGENILSGDASLDGKDRFREYRVKGKATGTDETFASKLAVAAQATDRGVSRTRVTILNQTGQSDDGSARLLAQWAAASAAGKYYKTTYTVQGWRQADGSLWRPNQLVTVRDGILGYDMQLLIGEVTYELGDKGCLSTLTVAPPGAWDLKPAAPAATASSALKPGETLLNF